MKKILQGTKALAIVLLLMMTATMVNAQKTAVASGNWSLPATWSPLGVPGAGDNVIINDGINVTVDVAASCASLTINGGANANTITINSGITLNVTTSGGGTGAITYGAPTDGTSDKIITLASATSVLNCVSITMPDLVTANDNTILNVNAGTVTVSGNLTMNANAAGENSVAVTTGTLNLGGSFSTTGDFTNNTGSIINYNGAAQTVRGATYSNLVLSGSGAKTTTGVTVNDKLTVGGTATVGNAITYNTAILEYNGTAAQTVSLNEFAASTSNISEVIINNTSGVTIGAARTLNGNLTLTAGTLAAGTNLTMGSGGTPIISVNGGSMTGTLQSGNDYDVDYTAGSQTTGGELSGTGLRNIDLNLTAATDVITLDQNRSPDGDITLGQGILDLGSFTINRSGVGGTLDVTNGATLRIGGTNSFPTNYSSHVMGGTSATVDYAGTAQSVIDLAGGENYTILILSGSGVKTLAASITVEVLLSIQGTATLAGSAVTYSTADLEYKGSASQTTSNLEFPAAMGADVIINNAAGVILNGAKTLSGTLTLTSGLLTTTATNLLIFPDGFTTVNGASNASFVNGPVRKNGNDAFTFPVGKGSLYSPLTITAPDNTGDGFTCEYFRASGTGLGGITSPGLTQVSNCEYWDLDESADAGGNTSISVTVNWYAGSGCGSNYITNYLTITLAHFNGVSWDSHAGTPSGNNTTGSIIRTGVTVFSPFTLGSTNLNENPLPVNFSDVKAFEKGTGVQIEWTNLTEKDLVSYIVERSANGRDFTEIAQVAPRSNQADKESYTSFDASPMAGANFYRIKVLEIDGKVIYSKLLKVDIGRITKGISIYPNPVAGKEVTVGFSAIKGQYTLRIINAAGQEVFTQRLSHPGGNISQAVILPSSVRSGIYNMLITGDNYKETKMFVVQ
ncbi:MAG: T9SS type A sorting domain-containing protein [Chitinophagaceae bacterium]|nr:T9SS type A sorting domain-containing protein [Chitinophagaceae bacterium]